MRHRARNPATRPDARPIAGRRSSTWSTPAGCCTTCRTSTTPSSAWSAALKPGGLLLIEEPDFYPVHAGHAGSPPLYARFMDALTRAVVAATGRDCYWARGLPTLLARHGLGRRAGRGRGGRAARRRSTRPLLPAQWPAGAPARARRRPTCTPPTTTPPWRCWTIRTCGHLAPAPSPPGADGPRNRTMTEEKMNARKSQLGRRRFLQGSAALAAGAGLGVVKTAGTADDRLGPDRGRAGGRRRRGRVQRRPDRAASGRQRADHRKSAFRRRHQHEIGRRHLGAQQPLSAQGRHRRPARGRPALHGAPELPGMPTTPDTRPTARRPTAWR